MAAQKDFGTIHYFRREWKKCVARIGRAHAAGKRKPLGIHARHIQHGCQWKKVALPQPTVNAEAY